MNVKSRLCAGLLAACAFGPAHGQDIVKLTFYVAAAPAHWK